MARSSFAGYNVTRYCAREQERFSMESFGCHYVREVHILSPSVNKNEKFKQINNSVKKLCTNAPLIAVHDRLVLCHDVLPKAGAWRSNSSTVLTIYCTSHICGLAASHSDFSDCKSTTIASSGSFSLQLLPKLVQHDVADSECTVH
jgi:hypothetical protein